MKATLRIGSSVTILFEIETPNAHLVWRAPARAERKTLPGIGKNAGHFKVKTGDGAHNPQARVLPKPPDECPRLYEETDYRIFVKSKCTAPISIRHVDPSVCNALTTENGGAVITGTVNFRSNVGLSQFSVYIDDKPEFEFEIEVFPTKLDYKSDYHLLLAETRWYLAELVFEFLRPTFRTAGPSKERRSDQISWVYILRSMIESLELAGQFVAHSPIRALVSKQESISAEKIKRIDATVRNAVSRGTGDGSFLNIGEIPVKQKLPHRASSFSLNTAEHRWIAFQLRTVRRRLQSLIEVEATSSKRWESDLDASANETRDSAILKQLRELSNRIQRLEKLEPFDAATAPPPPGFTSLQLMSAPGYKECYQLLSLLRFGLNLDSEILQLSVKEISLLYEYWCFLTLVSMIAIETGAAIPVSQLVSPTARGMRIALRKGAESVVSFKLKDDREITVTFNKQFANNDDSILIPQKPDIMVTLEGSGWPKLSLLLDAKYRVRCDDRILALYKTPGPDQDAINALHRYRDAILEIEKLSDDDKPKRTVIQAAALFPYRDSSGDFAQGRLWRSLEKIGIGAIPLVPTEKRYLQKWLANLLKTGEWALADKAIGHLAVEKREDWRRAASEPVLIGIIPAHNAKERLEWIRHNHCYYMPLRKTNPRQYSVRQIAIYEPLSRGGAGAINLVANVVKIEVVSRADISTPWKSAQQDEQMCILYRLDNLQPLSKAIKNVGSDRVSVERWTSRLALERATSLSELLLETEPEWRLYESLKHQGIEFDIRAGKIRDLKGGENGRAIFTMNHELEVVFAGAEGFIASHLGTEHGLSNREHVISFVLSKLANQNDS